LFEGLKLDIELSLNMHSVVFTKLCCMIIILYCVTQCQLDHQTNSMTDSNHN